MTAKIYDFNLERIKRINTDNMFDDFNGSEIMFISIYDFVPEGPLSLEAMDKLLKDIRAGVREAHEEQNNDDE